MARLCRQFEWPARLSRRTTESLIFWVLLALGTVARAQAPPEQFAGFSQPQAIGFPEPWPDGRAGADWPLQLDPRNVQCAFDAPLDPPQAEPVSLPMPPLDTVRSHETAQASAPMPQDEIAQPVEEAEPCECYSWQALPQGLIWHSPMAGAKEPRFASQWLQDRRYGSFWDITLGFREGILRYGSEGAENPQGFQVDIEGAAFPRLLPALNYELMSTDFRFGIPVTFGIGAYQMKIEVYHMSDHMGDKYESLNPDVPRINFNWNALSWGNSYYVTDDLRVYGEITGAFTYSDGAKPWEFQFGVDYSPVQPLWVFRCFRGAPFFALNVDFRETVDYQPGLTVQTGWQFRGDSGHLLRFGIDYFSGYSDQLEFYYQYENKFGLAVWYDF